MAKKRRRATVPEYMDYYVQMEHWTPQIGLGIDHCRAWQKPYWEDFGVKIQGRMLAPQAVRKFVVRGVAVEVTISGSRWISRIITEAEEKWDDRKPTGWALCRG
ncbi:MAG: hypothetical protein RLY93_11060 [Sumerlaeia bacterium]